MMMHAANASAAPINIPLKNTFAIITRPAIIRIPTITTRILLAKRFLVRWLFITSWPLPHTIASSGPPILPRIALAVATAGLER
jgi:hypothetical protein